MDDQHLDDMARRVAGCASRRDALRAVAAIIGVALLSAVGVSTTSAACVREGEKCAANRDCCAGSACRDRRCRCKVGLDPCQRAVR